MCVDGEDTKQGMLPGQPASLMMQQVVYCSAAAGVLAAADGKVACSRAGAGG